VLLHGDGRRVLLGRRSAARAWLPGVWDVPGGHCEPGEAPEAALVRELREELGVTPLAWEHLATGHEGGVTLHVYRVRRWDGTPRNARPDEHDALAWVSADEASGLPLAHPALGAVLRRAVALPPPGPGPCPP
jgi:mutator protein MutT